MAQIMNPSIIPRAASHRASLLLPPSSSSPHSFADLQLQLQCSGGITCFFSNNRKQEQAKKALESALGGKKEQFEKWNKEIKKREEDGGGGEAGGGGWFGGGGRFGWSNGDHFWEEAQQTSLTVLAIISIYLLISKGEVVFAAIVNPSLFALRRIRESFTYLSFVIGRKLRRANAVRLDNSPEKVSRPSSAKERVLKKWGSD